MLSIKYLDQHQAPFNRAYLRGLDNTLHNALADHPRTLAIRVDLRLSPDWYLQDTVICYPNLARNLMGRFIRAVDAKIEHYRRMLIKKKKRAHDNTLRYFWVKETDTMDYPHYHVVLFLNKDLFRGLGRARGNTRSLWNMIQEAWLSALDLSEQDEYRSLVHFPDNPTYVLDSHSADFEEQLASLVYRISYLAKERTKVYSQRERSVGYSYR